MQYSVCNRENQVVRSKKKNRTVKGSTNGIDIQKSRQIGRKPAD